MIGLACIVMLLVVALGLLTKVILDWRRPVSPDGIRTYRITSPELLAVSAMMMIVFVPAVLYTGNKLSIDNIVTYQQWVNGVETLPIDDVTTCYAGHNGSSVAAGLSNCHWVFQSGTNYWTTIETKQTCTSDSKGHQHCTSELVTKHHSAPIYTPFATREHSYSLKASVGYKELTYGYDNIYLDANPQAYGSRAIPADIPRGAPSDWLEAKRRLDAGDPRHITALDSYDNYILASGDEVLKTYSSQIEKYKQAKLLPPHTAGIMDDPTRGVTGWQADKVSFVGVSVPDPGAWQAGLMRFDAALGLKLQGDLHVVLVDSSKVSSYEAVDYTSALKAYWQGPDFEKRALAKNGIVVVIGVTGNSTIEWAKATTGMPFGNERMLQWIQDYLPGTSLTPEAVFGTPRVSVRDGKLVLDKAGHVVVLHSPSPGVLEHIMFQEAPFKRARMSCSDGTCVGYKDLLDKIEPTATQKFWMAVICLLIASGWWVWAAASNWLDALGMFRPRSSQASDSEDDSSSEWPDPNVDRTGAAASRYDSSDF